MSLSLSIKLKTSLYMGACGITNILGLSNVAENDKYWVQYDYQESKAFIFTHTKGGKETRFHRLHCGIHWLDTKAIKTGEYG